MLKHCVRWSNTCKRFRVIAESVFFDQHKEYKVNYKHGDSGWRRVVRKYGQYITSFDGSNALDIDADVIAQYCRPNLQKLSLFQAVITCDTIKPLMPQLTHVSFDMCDFDEDPSELFENCPNLERLFYEAGENDDDCEFLVRRFPKMVELAIDCAHPMYPILQPMLKLNPQIEHLALMAMADDYYISTVFQCAKQVKRLEIRLHVMGKSPQQQTKSVLLKLAKLQKLTELTMDAGCRAYAKWIGPLAEAFSLANIQLEKLTLRGVYIESKDIHSINKLKTLKLLRLNEMKNVNESDLISLTSNLPLLVELGMCFNYEVAITVDGLVEMIEGAKHLGYLELLKVRNLRIDQAAFEKLLEVVPIEKQGKLVIHITGCKTTTSLDVPEKIQKANTNRLKIGYVADDDNRCGCKRCEEEEE